MFQDYFLLHFLFNVLRLLFVSFALMFQDFSSLSHTKFFLHFHSIFSLLLLYIHIFTTLHVIPSQIHSNKKQCHLHLTIQCHFPLTIQCHLHSTNIVVPFDPKKGGLRFLFNDGSLWFWCWSRMLWILWRLWFALSFWVFRILVWESHKCILI